MQIPHIVLLVSSLAFTATSLADEVAPIAPAPNGIEFPSDYPNWRVISASHRTDNKTIRVILGNDIAIDAARAGNIHPWPDGAVLGKVVWKQTAESHWPAAIAPDKFVHAEFMFRDSRKWADNGTGWGWARWVGKAQKPYGLDAKRRLEVEAWLAVHPDAANRVRDYQLIQTQLHARFDTALTESAEMPPAPGRFSFTGFSRVAVVATLMLVSGLSGWLLKPDPDLLVSGPLITDLVQPAAFAHQVYSSDTRYPVEIPAPEQTSLNRWLSQRMHTDLRAPDLSRENLTFIGGRLLPSTNRMAAQFMYEDARGQRLTVYVRRVADPAGASEFKYREQDDLHVFYWIDGEMGYAVTGTQPASRLVTVASAVQASFKTVGRGGSD